MIHSNIITSYTGWKSPKKINQAHRESESWPVHLLQCGAQQENENCMDYHRAQSNYICRYVEQTSGISRHRVILTYH